METQAPVKARTLSKCASVLLVEDGRIIIHLDGNIQNNDSTNALTLFLNIQADNYLGMSGIERNIWDRVNDMGFAPSAGSTGKF